MKKEEKLNQFWKYVLLIVGGILILVPLLVTVFSSFKTTKDIMNHFLSLPNPSCSLFHCSKYVQEKSLCHYVFALDLRDICSISGDYDSYHSYDE